MAELDIFGYRYYYKRYLPHIQPVDAIFFITYNLDLKISDKFYKELLNRKKQFRKSIKDSNKKEIIQRKYNFNKKQFDFTDNFIGKYKNSPQWLFDSRIATIVKDSLFYRDNEHYNLLCYCIMPNHVHILIKPLQKSNGKPYSLAYIMKNHKSFTAVQSNKILQRNGIFWQRGYYDHYARNKKEFDNIIGYILNNPVKAGLVKDYQDWKFSWLNIE